MFNLFRKRVEEKEIEDLQYILDALYDITDEFIEEGTDLYNELVTLLVDIEEIKEGKI